MRHEMLAKASGPNGMAGGQALDVAAPTRQPTIADVEAMYARKTGALIRASVLMAAACVPVLSTPLREALASDSPALIEVVSDIARDYPPYKFHQPRLG